jgi:hypothetical protein
VCRCCETITRFFQAAAFVAAPFCANAHADDAPTDCDGCRDRALRARGPMHRMTQRLNRAARPVS